MNNSEDKWKEKLSKEQYNVLRNKNTEIPFTGKYVKFNKIGKYVCAACNNELFDSKTKFNAHCGWPSFYDAKKDAVKFINDTSHGMQRTEVICKKCNSHLGHIFNDGPIPTKKRFCSTQLHLILKRKKVKKLIINHKQIKNKHTTLIH
jgi:peptide-methionine (R)-S-oxide reductase